MKIDIALIYWYYVSWSFVGCNIPSYDVFGCHALDNDDLDYGTLDCDAMVGPRKNPRAWSANYSLTCRVKSLQIVSDENCCANVDLMGITTSHALWLCRWL
jgi:hypothetical protein